MPRQRMRTKYHKPNTRSILPRTPAEQLETRRLLSAITFAAQTTYTSGSSPRAVAIANLGNGKQDIVVTNDSSNTVSVYLGNGDGTFQPQVTYPVGNLPLAVAIADLGNGHPDLVVANDSDATVSVLLGNGDGTFQPQVTYAVGNTPDGVAIADLGNGKADLVVANSVDQTVSVLLGNGDGTFQPQTTYATAESPSAVQVANLGNGHPDIIVADNSSGATDVGVLLGNGDGTFGAETTYATGSGLSSIAVGDLGNGNLDVVGTNLNDNTLSVLLGNGNGTLQAQQTIATGSFPTDVAIGDLGNGHPDLVVTNSVDNTIGVYTGNGTGTFGSPTTFATGADPITLAIANLGNGQPDVVVANADADNIGVLLNDTPNSLTFSQEPANGSTTNTLAAVKVSVEKPNGSVSTSDTSNVTLTIASGPSGAALGGTTTVAASAGVATFSNLTLTTAGTYTLTATDGTDTTATSTSFTITVPAANKLTFSQEPGSTTTNTTLAAVTVDIENSAGTLLSSDTSSVTLSIAAGPTGGAIGGTTTVAAVGGVATFNTLTFATAGMYELTAADGSDTTAMSTSFQITAPAPNKVVFAVEPVSTTTSTTLAPVKIDLENAAGTLLSSDTSSVTLAIATGPAGAAIGGTATVAAVGGIATFSNLSFATAGTYTLTATDGTDTAATSTSFTISAPGVNKAVFTVEPVSTTTSTTLAPVKVDLENSAGTLLSSDTSSVTLTIATGPAGAAIGGTATVAAVGGVATFGTLSFATAGTYTLTASDGSDTAATSTPFTITAPAVNKLAFAQEPVSTTTTMMLAPVKVDVENSAGMLLNTDASHVSLAVATGPAGATLGGTTTVTAIGGVATFSNLSLPTAGTYTLIATDGTNTSATSTSFTISLPSANKLAYGAQPVSTTTATTLSPVKINIETSAAILIGNDTSNVTLAIASGPAGATLGGTATVSAVGGIATFSNLSFATAGTYTLIATDGTDTAVTSVSFTISPPLANKLAFSTQPVSGTPSSGLGTITIDVENNAGTLLTTDNSNVTLNIATGPAGATLGGTTTVAAVNGIATFTDLFVATPGTNYSLIATDGTDVPASSGAFTITAPVTHTLAFVQQPVNTSIAGTVGTITVDIEDSSGNLVTTDENPVTLAIAGSPAGVVLGGTTTVAAVNGVATFSNVSINTVGSYTLTATEAAEAAAISTPFTVYYPPVTVGQLDPTFGVGGLVKSNVGFTSTAGVANDGAQAVVIGTTGAVPAESFSIARYNADGTLDAAFGTSGVTSIHFANTDDVPTAVDVLAGGQILIAGTATTYLAGVATTSQFAVAELNADGTIDTSFGNGTGMVEFGFSTAATHDVLTSMALGPNGIMYLGGSSDSRSTTGNDFAIIALTSTGAPYAGFGAGGQLLIDFDGASDTINSLAVQANGDLVAAGSATVGSVTDIALARILPTGVLDRRFGTKGLVTTSVRGVFDSATSVAIEPKGQIVVGGLSAGVTVSSSTADFVVARYTAAGRLDRSFDGTGTVVTSFGGPSAVTQVLVQANGEIVASGKTTASLTSIVANETEIAVARYTVRGVLDGTFNGSGQTVIDLSTATFTTGSVFTIVPLDTTPDLESEFDQLIASKQGVAVSVASGDILDVGNSGDATVEAEIITTGVDLATALVTQPPAAIAGGTKAFATVRITEAGADLASGTVTLQLEIATDALGNGATLVKTLAERINLPAGRSRTYRVPFVYPATLPTSHYYILANVISGSTPAMRDLNQLNNLSPETATVAISPPVVSLAGSALSNLSSFTDGRIAHVELTLSNDGNVLARGRTVINFYLSTDQTIANGTLVASSPLGIVLQPGAAHIYRLSFVVPKTTTARPYTLIAVVDPMDSLGSTDHTNSTVIDATTVTVG